MIVKKGFFLRQRRWCCENYKEKGGNGRIVLLGLRREESTKRKNRKVVESCRKREKDMVNPILEWTNTDVWQYIKENKLAYCKLYDEGFTRLGCIGCPMKGNRMKEFERWPKYKADYLHAFNKLYKDREKKGIKKVTERWQSAEDMFNWWLLQRPAPYSRKQLSLFD